MGTSRALTLDGRVVVVTGASVGLGKAYAEALSAAGARVVVSGRREDLVKELADRLTDAIAVPGDIAVPETAAEIVRRARSAFGRIDVVVNNAGSLHDRTLLKMTDDEFDDVIKSHVYGTFYLSRSCAQAMKDNQGGMILNVGSDAGLLGAFGQTNYAAAKGAIMGMTLTWAQELQRHGVSCNCILPNALTEMTRDLPDLLAAYRYGEPGTMFPRAMGQAAEVAPLVVLLAAGRWQKVNGALLSLGGDKLSVWQPPAETRTAFMSGGWTVEDLDGSMELALGPVGRSAEG